LLVLLFQLRLELANLFLEGLELLARLCTLLTLLAPIRRRLFRRGDRARLLRRR